MYGYEWTGERFEIIPHEAEAIRFMYQAFVDGMTMTQISKALAEKGIFNRKGKPFGQTSIGRILTKRSIVASVFSNAPSLKIISPTRRN